MTERKLNILKILGEHENGCFLDFLAKKTKLSAPLLSYHLYGTTKGDGLKQFGLIDVAEQEGKVLIKINMLGRMLMKGYFS